MEVWAQGPHGDVQGGMVLWMELVLGGWGYKYWTLDFTHHHSLSLSSLLQRWVRLKVVSIDANFFHSR